MLVTSETPVLIFSLIFRTRYYQCNGSKTTKIPTDTLTYLKSRKKNVSLAVIALFADYSDMMRQPV